MHILYRSVPASTFFVCMRGPLCVCGRVRVHLAPLVVYGSGICWQWVAVQEREAESQYHGLKLCHSIDV